MNENSGTTPRRLSRSSSNKVIAGVAGGLADYTGLDPVIFRIGFIALAVAGGSGLLMYLLAWLVIPAEGSPAAPASGLIERARRGRWLPLALIAIAVIILIESLGSWGGPGLWAVALIAVGIALLQDEPDEIVVPSSYEAHSPAAGVPATPAARAARVRRRRSPLGLYTLGATLLAVACAVAIAGTEVVEMDLGQFLGLAVLVIGVGLTIGGWWGRARWLVLPGIALIPLMLAASVIDVPLKGSLGGSEFYGGDGVPVKGSYELLAGSLYLDLSRHEFGPEPTEIDIDFVAGDVDVWVPPGVRVTTTGELDAGVVDLFGESHEGSDIDLGGTHTKPGLTEGELILHVRGGLGSFDTSWANWVDDEIRRRMDRREKREEANDGKSSGPAGGGGKNKNDGRAG